jgi:hypothetical protein
MRATLAGMPLTLKDKVWTVGFDVTYKDVTYKISDLAAFTSSYPVKALPRSRTSWSSTRFA